MKLLSIASLVLALSPVSALADDWKHHFFTATNGTSIQVDYQSGEWHDRTGMYGQTARPVWVNVVLPEGSDCNVSVRAVLNNISHSAVEYYDGKIQDAFTLDLQYAGRAGASCRFSAQVPSGVTLSSIGRGRDMDFTQTIAVVVRGSWLVDPISGTGDFSFKMM